MRLETTATRTRDPCHQMPKPKAKARARAKANAKAKPKAKAKDIAKATMQMAMQMPIQNPKSKQWQMPFWQRPTDTRLLDKNGVEKAI